MSEDTNSNGAHVHVDLTEQKILISEPSARLLLTICDKVTAQGSAAKFQLAIAQGELEQGLAKVSAAQAEAPPPNRKARRERERTEKAGAA